MNIKKFILSFFVLVILLVTISSVFAQSADIKQDALISGYHEDLYTLFLHNMYKPTSLPWGPVGIGSFEDLTFNTGKALKFFGTPNSWKIMDVNGNLVFSDFNNDKNVLSLSQTGDVVVDLSS